MKILGLDVSTSVVGWAITDESGTLLDYGAWDLKNKNKFPDIFEKAKFVGDEISSLDFDRVFIEQNLFMFQAGASSAKVLNQLSKFNGMVSILCFLHKKIKPEYVSSGTARKLNDIKIPRGSKAKEVVMKTLLDIEPTFSVTYTPKGNVSPKYYDMADAIVVARAGSVSARKEKRSLSNNK